MATDITGMVWPMLCGTGSPDRSVQLVFHRTVWQTGSRTVDGMFNRRATQAEQSRQ
jgi:hypothetical protein